LRFFSARFLTKKIIEPLNTLDLDKPLENVSYDEIVPLLRALEDKNQRIRNQISLLSGKQREFDFLTENMNEGLVIFSDDKTISYINKMACGVFSFTKNNSENDTPAFLSLCRNAEYARILEDAFAGRSGFSKMADSNHVYLLSANAVETELGLYGAVLFVLDITEKEMNEEMRKEFTANVSHELKTPLTSIMGYAEIIENGIAKTEDTKEFAGKIHKEASRLLTVIEDIIRLSQFDENKIKDEFNNVDLYGLCETVIDQLSLKARGENVSLSLEGGRVFVNGIKSVLGDMIYNLCDNGINYNKNNGTVVINLSENDGKIILSVKDSGIGVARVHQSRVFERFYRVNKSRSKESGGTGLGLSIVKHGAQLHKAEIQFESALDAGTEVRILFNSQ
jgi:two-component system phosphate regulon sensor histidine kinase PhoR